MPKVLSRRKQFWIGGTALLVLGAAGCSQSGQDDAAKVAAASARPAPTVTVTVTATATATETATPAPAPTVTKTKTVKVPGPTVTKTVTRAASSGSGGSGGSSGGAAKTSTCSIRSNAGNCYSAGQFCRNSDHGALTTTASGARIKCNYSGSAWRWSYA
ncbi:MULTISPECIES: hypothetical protein [unclassified Streptomyces]|uniref:hypothetical protein n=1 Tax=unclassified Streptomyces TaxID=2593676 RepID=UPI002ECFDA7D|nr:hypothetical protein OH827_14070 [Streptomyces sp. NBC_00891]WSY06070.1 hypothetical protein OG464_14070 [Streptomyces sp. NBC_00890]WSZ07694.1 hypothetical protein OG704_14070 [Streptomyces sp. NBC_00869]WSZ24807.1 hypothetical protein OG498_19495 [Streptomyces sp. NBC_00870]